MVKQTCLVLIGATGALFVLSAAAAPQPLDTAEMDRITAAGSTNPAPNGGAIVGNGSSATLESRGEVIIDEAAQNEVRAMNFVNSSESTVANGVNVFDSRDAEAAALEGAQFDLSQSNIITQDQRRLSSLPSYERGANTETIRTNAGSASRSSATSLLDEVVDLERTFTSDAVTTEGSFSNSSAPTLRIDLDGDIVLGGSDPIFDADGTYTAEFNAPSTGNSAGLVFNGGVDFDVDGGDISIDTGDLGVLVDINLPELGLEFDAMGCLAVNGSCTIDGTRTTTSDEISDHSTLYTLEESSSSDKTWDRTFHEVVNAAFELRDAQAEYIVVDESAIDVSAAYLVNLSGGAQSGLRAMNLVNAAGSAVANGVNVASHRTGTLEVSGGPLYSLNQSNVINHSR